MKHYLLFLLFIFSSSYILPNSSQILSNNSIQNYQNNDRKLSDEEVKQRGIDHLVAEIIEKIDEIDLRKMARSSIFETSYGFRWKMVNLHTSKVIIVKVDKDFKLISARDGNNLKIMNP